MNIQSKFEMPKIINDGRVDTFLEILFRIKEGHSIELSFKKTQTITPAGHALLFIILDAACEQKIFFKISDTHQKLNLHHLIYEASNPNVALRGFYDIKNLNIKRENLIVYGKSSSVAPEFIQMVESKFKDRLGEDQLWDVQLTFNELMQNTVDHSTAERYFLYAGVSDRNFEFGILDMGVTIPAKLEVKYRCKDDCEYLKKVFEEGVGTRRDRAGGLGLYYLFENVKKLKGRLVILSRDAQVRNNFGTRNYKASKLKERLSGTWCMANIPMEKK